MPSVADKNLLPASSGAYALLLPLRRRLKAWPGSGPILTPGLYLYAGSANGPGGIRARVLRHARRKKPRHWHVDRLTGNARVAAIAALAGGNECAIVEAVSALPQTTVPVPGFGSSDCRTCQSHLLALPESIEAMELNALLPNAVWWRDSSVISCTHEL